MTLAEAYAACERQARSHYENFPVASVLLPRRMRPHVAAVYAFARTADDMADEGDAPPAARLAQLDDWLAQLHAAVGGSHSEPRAPSPACPAVALRAKAGAPSPWPRVPNSASRAPVFVALAETIRALGLPIQLFDDLVSAFKQDVETKRYESWDQLLDYCRRSANPVGRLVLRIAGIEDDRLDLASDAVCTALQLTNFWQDIERDWQKGRVYVPAADRSRFGAEEADLEHRRWTPAWRLTLGDMADRTRAMFDAGRPVCDGVAGRLRHELRITWLGGRRVLARLESAGFDVFESRPALGAADVPALVWQALTWKSGRAR